MYIFINFNNRDCLFFTYRWKINDMNNNDDKYTRIVQENEIFTVTMEKPSKHMNDNKARNSPHNGIFIVSSNAVMNLKKKSYHV
jgi:hypothetical protein